MITGKLVNERATSPFAVLKSKVFTDYVEANEHRLLDTVAGVVSGWPNVMGNYDYRFDKSDFMCRVLDHHFSQLFYDGKNGTIGYDMIFNRHSRISVKTQQDIFQMPGTRKPLLAPKEFIIHNPQRDSKPDYENELFFDYLLAIQTGRTDGVLNVQFGVASYDTARQYFRYKSNGQTACRLRNDEWDYLSALLRFEIDDSAQVVERKNDVFQTGRDNMAMELYSLGKKSITPLGE